MDRRQTFRGRVYYGGRIVFNERQSTIDCIVRNISPTGARLEFTSGGAIPRRMDLLIPSKGVAYLATKVWQRGKLCGLTFRNAATIDERTLDMALRQRAYERANKALRRTVEQLRCFG